MVTELKGTYVGKYCRIMALLVTWWVDKFFLRRQEVGLLHSAGFRSAGNKLHLSTMCLLSPEQVLENDFVL